MLSHADDRIGEVLDAIDRLQLTDDTLVIFTSDNGPARSPRPVEPELMYDTATGAGWGIGVSKGITACRKGYKSSLFEGGINEHWKLLSSTDGSHVELYDLQNDPLEKDDLSTSQPELVDQLRQKLDEWVTSLPAHPSGAVFSRERTPQP